MLSFASEIEAIDSELRESIYVIVSPANGILELIHRLSAQCASCIGNRLRSTRDNDLFLFLPGHWLSCMVHFLAQTKKWVKSNRILVPRRQFLHVQAEL